MTWSVAELERLVVATPGDGGVVYAFAAVDGVPRAAQLAVLDGVERARAERFVRARDGQRFVLAHAALRYFLGALLERSPAGLRFAVDAHGKPRLADGAAGLAFNLSHSGSVALLAAAGGRDAVGVDVEQARDVPLLEEIAAGHFSPAEQAQLLAIPAAERAAAFLRCWTRKEAIIKADGRGLGMDLASFDVELGSSATNLLLAQRGAPGQGFELRALAAPAGYVAAGAVNAGLCAAAPWRELVPAVLRDPPAPGKINDSMPFSPPGGTP